MPFITASPRPVRAAAPSLWAAARPLIPLLAGAFLTACSGEAPEPTPREISLAPIPFAPFSDPGALTDAWADVDGDGDPDRFVGFNDRPARLYRNDGLSGFTDIASEVGIAVDRPIRSAAWGDMDADGDPDLALGMAGDEGPALAVYRNEDGGFVEVAAEVGLGLPAPASTRQASWVDVDGDGDLDLFLALRDGPNRLWRNDGEGFVDISADSGLDDPRRSVGAVWFDADVDGDLDLYVANMDGDANGLWRNDDGSFVDVAEEWGLADGGRATGDETQGTVRPCVADFDHDGDLDLYTANYGPNGLFQNPGEPGDPWPNVAAELGVAGDSRDDTCAFGDADNDGRMELFVNGTVSGGTAFPERLYRWAGSAYEDVWPAELADLAASHGATWVDTDRDGDLELALTGVADDGMHHLLQNLLRPEFAGHSLQIRVRDGAGAGTRPGAVVRLYVPGTRTVLHAGMVDTGSGYDAQSDLPLHFGLPGAQPVDVVVTIQGPDGPRQAVVGGIDPSAFRGDAVELTIGG